VRVIVNGRSESAVDSALKQIRKASAEYCSGSGVTVNAILPGPTRSAGAEDFVTNFSKGQSFEEFEKEFFKTVRPSSLIKRFALPDKVAALVVFICSPRASAITGTALHVDGGVVRFYF
jgi:NAD(P)-dependent dehydrogenase (short-subunit alcohol dehydrogenase family)